ncbi:MAG: cobalamin-binding protein [Bryobacteraceae bacterium]
MRIVSLIASASEIVHSLGLTPYQVGRSHECDHPEQIRSLPICTAPGFPTNGSSAEIDRLVKQKLRTAVSVYEVFTHVLQELQPTHILTQTQCEVCAVSLEGVERALAAWIGSRPTVVSLEPNALADIWNDIRRTASACGVSGRGDAVVASLRDRLSSLVGQVILSPSRRRPRVACIEWHEPLMAAGNWVPELVELANADNLFGTAGQHSPWMTWEDLTSADPDVIITMPCGFDLERTRQEMYWLTDRAEWSGLRAVRQGRIYLADGNRYMNRPGPTVVDSLQILAEILHPDVFEPKLEGTAWQRWSA